MVREQRQQAGQADDDILAAEEAVLASQHSGRGHSTAPTPSSRRSCPASSPLSARQHGGPPGSYRTQLPERRQRHGWHQHQHHEVFGLPAHSAVDFAMHLDF